MDSNFHFILPPEDDDVFLGSLPPFEEPSSPERSEAEEEEEQVEQKYQIPCEPEPEVDAFSNDDVIERDLEQSPPVSPKKLKTKKPGKKRSGGPTKKASKVVKKGNRKKETVKTNLRTKQGKRHFTTNSWIAKTRKRFKIQNVSRKTMNQAVILSKLEKKISVLTKKLKRAHPLCSKGVQLTGSTNSAGSIQVETPNDLVEMKVSEFSTCKECGQTYRTQYLKVHHETVHNPNHIRKRQCPLCPREFKQGIYAWRHFRTSHLPHNNFDPEKLALEVPEVLEETNNEELSDGDTEATKTNETEAQPNSWDCPNCDNKPFATKASLQRHLHLIHGEGTLPDAQSQFICTECGKSFKEKASLTQHEKRAHLGMENRCEVCSRCFQTGGKLWKHKVDEHGIIDEVPSTSWGSVQCEYCGENCLQGKQYIHHIEKVHPDMLEEAMQQEKNRRLENSREVKRKFRRKRKLNGIKSSSSKVVSCPKCDRHLKSDLSRHICRVHKRRPQKTYYCPLADCDKKFLTRMNLKIHLYATHDPALEKIRTQTLIDVINGRMNGGGVVLYECRLCGWRIGSRIECNMHLILAHPHFFKEDPGEKPVKCPHCEEVGSSLDQIKKHAEMIHPESVWRCPHPECQKIILNPVDLQEHFHKHHNKKTKIENVLKKKRLRDQRKRGLKKKRRRNQRRKVLRKRKERITTTQNSIPFPCYRCNKTMKTNEKLGEHVKSIHPNAYWPCQVCGQVYFAERSLMFHQTHKCSGEQSEFNMCTVVGYDQIEVNCPICEIKLSLGTYSEHLRNHGVNEDGIKWKCDKCRGKTKRKFEDRLDWLAHMEDCHGDKVDMDKLIDTAKMINSTRKVNSDKMMKIGKTVVGTTQKTRSGRVIKMKRSYSDDSDDEDYSDIDSKRTKVTLPARQSRSSRRVGSLKVKPTSTTDIQEIMDNLPLKIRKMFTKQCSVRLERLTPGQIEK